MTSLYKDKGYIVIMTATSHTIFFGETLLPLYMFVPRYVDVHVLEFIFFRFFNLLLKSCCCFCVEFVKLLPVHQYRVDHFSYSGPSEYWVLTENRIPLTLVVGGVRIVALSISSQ